MQLQGLRGQLSALREQFEENSRQAERVAHELEMLKDMHMNVNGSCAYYPNTLPELAERIRQCEIGQR